MNGTVFSTHSSVDAYINAVQNSTASPEAKARNLYWLYIQNGKDALLWAKITATSSPEVQLALKNIVEGNRTLSSYLQKARTAYYESIAAAGRAGTLSGAPIENISLSQLANIMPENPDVIAALQEQKKQRTTWLLIGAAVLFFL